MTDIPFVQEKPHAEYTMERCPRCGFVRFKVRGRLCGFCKENAFDTNNNSVMRAEGTGRVDMDRNFRFAEDEIRKIRASLVPATHLCEVYGVSPSAIRLIRRRKTYAWVS